MRDHLKAVTGAFWFCVSGYSFSRSAVKKPGVAVSCQLMPHNNPPPVAEADDTAFMLLDQRLRDCRSGFALS